MSLWWWTVLTWVTAEHTVHGSRVGWNMSINMAHETPELRSEMAGNIYKGCLFPKERKYWFLYLSLLQMFLCGPCGKWQCSMSTAICHMVHKKNIYCSKKNFQLNTQNIFSPLRSIAADGFIAWRNKCLSVRLWNLANKSGVAALSVTKNCCMEAIYLT